jgi:hypothetical protein
MVAAFVATGRSCSDFGRLLIRSINLHLSLAADCFLFQAIHPINVVAVVPDVVGEGRRGK